MIFRARRAETHVRPGTGDEGGVERPGGEVLPRHAGPRTALRALPPRLARPVLATALPSLRLRRGALAVRPLPAGVGGCVAKMRCRARVFAHLI